LLVFSAALSNLLLLLHVLLSLVGFPQVQALRRRSPTTIGPAVATYLAVQSPDVAGDTGLRERWKIKRIIGGGQAGNLFGPGGERTDSAILAQPW
jgi:hypothetical protein